MGPHGNVLGELLVRVIAIGEATIILICIHIMFTWVRFMGCGEIERLKKMAEQSALLYIGPVEIIIARVSGRFP